MIPILFNAQAVTYTKHGIGDLMECISCAAIQNGEGEWELELVYPATGTYVKELLINRIILAKANDHQGPQAFRIYGIDKSIDSLITVHAQHISYDLSGIVVKPIKTTKCSDAMSRLKKNAIGSRADLYAFSTTIPDTQEPLNQDREFKMEEPASLRAALLDGDDSIKGCFGGDLVFDNFDIQLLKVGGEDRGVLIEYGIDMMDMQQEENISEMVTGVYPYWKGKESGSDSSADDTIVYGDTQIADGNFDRHRIIPLNVTEYYPNSNSAPSVASINETARNWMKANEIGQPQINLTISYAHLNKDVRLHDAITVRFVKIGVDVKAKVTSYKYDVLKDCCVEIEVGHAKPSILFSLEDASRLKRGLIPPKRIQNNSIDSTKLSNAAVGSSQLGGSAVGNWHIKESAVTSEKIGKNEVKTYNLGPLSVTEEKIGNGAVETRTIGEHAITTVKIDDGAVVSGKIGESAIISTKINNGSVVTEKLADGSVQYRKVTNGHIDTLKLNDFSITSTKLSAGSGYIQHPPDATHDDWWTEYVTRSQAVGQDQIQNNAIVTAKIGDQQVAEVKLVQETQDAIAVVWELDRLIARDITTMTASFSAVNSTHLYVGNNGGGSFGIGGGCAFEFRGYPIGFIRVKDVNGVAQSVLGYS